MFKQAKLLVVAFLKEKGLIKGEDFTKVNGKEVLTEDQHAALVENYGEKFAENFEKDLKASQESGAQDPLEARLNARFAEYEQRLGDLSAENADLKNQVDALSDSGETEPMVEVVKGEKGGKVMKFKPNMNYKHNQVAENYLTGDQTMIITAGDTIDQNVIDEFGALPNVVKLPMVRDIITGFPTAMYLNWKRAIEKWRATKSEITRVIQQFTAEWTPLGKASFTPLAITNYRFKINMPIKPADLEDWIYEMYDESKDLDQMPVTLYIINNLLIPKAQEDLEDICAIAEYVEIVADPNEGDAGQDPFSAMEGFVTQLQKEKASGTSAMNFLLDGVTLTRENIVTKMETFADAINKNYKKKNMPVYADPDVVKMYNRAYQDKYPTTKNADGTMNRIDHTKLTLIPLDSMTDTGAFFATPAENFVGLRHKNEPGATRLFAQKQNYTLKLFAEFWFGVGFAIADAVFAYLPPVEASGSGSGA